MANLKFLRYKTTSEFNTAKTNKSFKQGDIVFDSEAKILYIVTDDTPTLEPYYGNNAIKDVSCSGATITVTLSDGSTKSITVNNVASAGTATNATNDSDGNKINTTYFKKSGGTIDGATTINGGLTATGETDVESLTADSLIVNGSTRFNNNVTADTFTGNLKGNADTATSASTAGTASKLSTNAGSATQPIYFKDGVPTAITGPIANNTTGKASTAGTADCATKLGNSTNSYTYSDVWNQFTALTTADTNLSNRIGDSELAIGNKLSEIENNINDITDWQQKPTADEIITNRLGVLESINIGGTILDKTEYQGNAKTATTASSAASASKLTSSAGSATLPVYFDGGIPKVINTTGVGISITGSATKATQDANGNVITETYATKTELADKSNSTHNHDGRYLLKQRMTSPNTNSPGVGITPFNVLAYKNAGTPLFTDPEFETGTNSVGVYNNSANGTVTLTRGLASDFGIEYSGNHSKYVLKLVHSGQASPGIGGFYAPVYSNPNKVFVEIFRAMIPVGYQLQPQANSFGDGGTHEFITDPNGTGKWEWYAIMISCGKTGTFSSVGHVNLAGNTPSTDNPITWYISYLNVIDITASDYDGLRTKYADEATTASSAATAGTASKTQAALTFGSQTFDGSSAKTITAADLGLSSALKFLGTTTTALSDAATTNPITINGANVTAQIGNVVLYGHLEFLWNGSKWEELGDEQSFALKSVQINAGSGLTGGGTLEATRTISHADTSSQASVTTGGRTYINSITLDGYGHVTKLGTGTETNQTDISGNAATVTNGVYTNTAQTITGQKNFNTNSNSVPVLISRAGGTTEALKIGVDDSVAYFEHQQDETVSDFRFIGKWLDTESGGGANAGSAYVQFNLSSTNVGINLNGKTVYHSGNLTKLSQLSDDLGIAPVHSHSQYALKTGDTITGAYTFNNKVTFNDSVSIADLTASSLIVNGSTRFNNAVIASTFTGNLEGNAKTATSATSASSVPWSGVTGKPTTLSGYGITDGVPTYTVNVAQTDLTWIKAIAAKKANRMSFYYNHNGSEWSYLLGCRNIDADDSLTYGSILKFGYADTYLRILRITSGSWLSSDWEKISAGYADTSGSCSGNAATATTATTATSTSGLICSDVRGADRSPDTYFTAKRVSALFNNSITGANNTWNSAIHVHGWTSGYVAWELIGPASDSIGSDNLYWREGINSTWQSVRKILDSSNYNNYAPTLSGTGATGTWGINISGNASISSACSGNSATATVANSAIGTNLSVDPSTLINAGFLASDYTSRYDTVEFLKAFVKWAQTNYSGRSIFGILNPNSRGYFFIDCYYSGFNSSTGYPEHCTGRYYPHSGISYIFGTSYGSWYCYDGISSANIASQSVKYATSAGTATSCSGNSATTTKLATAVNINGTSFNGASSITTANWGTARNITITDGTNTGAAVSVNGSAAVSLKLPTTISANFKGGTISGTTGTFSSSLSVTGDIAASSNVNVTNQTKSKTFNIDGGCTLEYDSTNKCVKFVF